MDCDKQRSATHGKTGKVFTKEYYLRAEVPLKDTGAENGDCCRKTGSKRSSPSADLGGLDVSCISSREHRTA